MTEAAPSTAPMSLFRKIEGPPPNQKRRTTPAIAALHKALQELPVGESIEYVGEKARWENIFYTWAKLEGCKIRAYIAEDGRKVVVKVKGPAAAAPKPAAPAAPEPDPAPPPKRPPAAPQRGLAPDQVNPDAKPHQGKRLRATPLL